MTAASAPLRVDLTGGYTDIPEISSTLGGIAINFALGLRTWVITYKMGPTPPGAIAIAPNSHSTLFAERLYYHLNVLLDLPDKGFVGVRSEGPVGCGLGSSASLAVALANALEPKLTKEDTVRVCCAAARFAGNVGGVQDEVAAAWGGMNVLRWPGGPERLDVSDSQGTLDFVQTTCSVWHQPFARSSGTVVESILQSLIRGDHATVTALEQLVAVDEILMSALEERQVERLVAGVRAVHTAQCGLAEVVPESVRDLAEALSVNHDLGTKVLGGGGRGAALLLAGALAHSVAVKRVLSSKGYIQIRLDIDTEGVVVL